MTKANGEGGKEAKVLLAASVRVSGNEVVEDDQEEEGDAEHVGEHGELRVGDHLHFDIFSPLRPENLC